MKHIIFLFLVITPLCNAQNSLFNQVKATNIGPTIMSGRVVDVAVNPKNTTEFYVAYASGGLWYTQNNGTSFLPVMDNATTINCGAVTVDWNSGTLWVGTGEINASRSSYAGVGVLTSSDKGKTWKNLGLIDSHHISKIWVNPSNLNEIVVAALGHLYTTNKERGIFKSSDGGKSWQKTLFDEGIRTSEDKLWARAILDFGSKLAYAPSVAVVNKSQYSLAYMFRKGQSDARADKHEDEPSMQLWQLAGALKNLFVKKFLGEIDYGNWIRCSAHAFGQYSGSRLDKDNTPRTNSLNTP
jgi:hypothetical protein